MFDDWLFGWSLDIYASNLATVMGFMVLFDIFVYILSILTKNQNLTIIHLRQCIAMYFDRWGLPKD